MELGTNLNCEEITSGLKNLQSILNDFESNQNLSRREMINSLRNIYDQFEAFSSHFGPNEITDFIFKDMDPEDLELIKGLKRYHVISGPHYKIDSLDYRHHIKTLTLNDIEDADQFESDFIPILQKLNLKELCLYGCKFNLIDKIKSLKSLTIIDSDLLGSELTNLPNLEKITLWDVEFTSLDSFLHLPKLKNFFISFNDKTRYEKHEKEIKKLRESGIIVVVGPK